ncbi:MAG TPA: hypothetical protein DD808_15975 [Halieaceae bacterium]|jgi:glycosyltransferase involved in cell wall biosynthesis|uniref:glycosyltransferase family 2 protein n=1 Tax=Haliea sp. TaxID=1932666 RepID=UPI000C5C19F9|nr:glycosyltransferase family 2 protein [Haliea sp.]HBQ42045.1 hypothetical protein [Halieaceae bacterium]MAD62056.1 hypothetical protein [Haliea sp.]MAY93941.1 hypothetical protein [Haliea sp.]MBK41700.1 hypothetical protein [Haliea sp.]MBP70647.1 hypothetical protein [Haliea sp.]|tara:strand:+ start:4195 stop:5214 length:1020 start_codon:yes stop_codon:yes gene_type:complete
MSAIEAYNESTATAAEKRNERPFFSVVLPTRNRPELFNRALNSVLEQSFQDFEVLVVNDGSDDDYLERYKELEASADPRVRWHYQAQRPNGHGPSYSINTGAHRARGLYLCILDDDDSWDAVDHLQQAHAAITATGAVDAYYSNQTAYRADGMPVQRALWLNALARKLPQPGVTQPVDPEFLLSCPGFPHLNCSIIKRELYLGIGGMDEGIRYECEVDLYLRTLDAASLILYNPTVVARHNVPDVAQHANVSTNVTRVGKLLSQCNIYQKNLATANSVAVQGRCRDKLTLAYKNLAQAFAEDRDFPRATTFARMALAFRYTIKWRLYCLQLALLAAFRG